jgi:serine/threonine protein kinase
MIGTTISHYQILEKLGEGGMGIVYKAQDTKLDRVVALKFLPAHVSVDEQTKARFLQEAKAAASLNHPNICTIYGVEETEAKMFIAMEYVEGGTLHRRLPYTKPDDAVSTAIQIAEGLQEAHSKGIVHRDIKADNIMLSAKGQPKVMDFGLAKLKGSLKLTRTSSTVGTLAYMAPEQIQGEEADARSDIFAFGVLFFEMLTGKLPFRGEHEAAMMYSIVNEEPQDPVAFVPELSPIVVNLIQRCLEKDPKDRYQHFDDIVADLHRSQKKTGRLTRSTSHLQVLSPSSSTTVVAPPSSISNTFAVVRRDRTVQIAAAVVVVAIVGLAVWKIFSPSLPGVNPAMAVSTLQIPATEYQYPGISADGKWVTFPGADVNGKWDIYMMLIETGENKRITTDSSQSLGNAATSRFSPDGSSIVYSRLNRQTGVAEVCVVSVLTGQSRVVADTGVSPQWSSTGERILYARGPAPNWKGRSRWGEYWSVSPQGGEPTLIFADTLARGGTTFFSLGLSPDGKKVIFTRPVEGGHNEIFTHDIQAHEERQITFDNKDIDEAVWSSNGYIFFTSNRGGNFNIWAIPEYGGTPQQITQGAGPDNAVTYSASANRLVYSQRTNVATLWAVGTDGKGHRQLFPDENIQQSHVAADGNSLVLQVIDEKLLPTLMIREIAGGRQEFLFPFDKDVGRAFPRWSPSGKMVSYIEFYRRNTRRFFARILDLAGGRRVRDLGEGLIAQWITDSLVIVARPATPDTLRPTYPMAKVYELSTNREYFAYKDSVRALPLLQNSAIGYFGEKAFRILPASTFRSNPAAQGTVIVRIDEMSASFSSDSWFYFRSAARDAFWKVDLKTLRRTKILDLIPRDNINFGGADYNDKIVTYSIQKLKTKIVKIDNVFLP